VGRLDLDSEGLLLLTNDRRLNNRLLNPKFKHDRTYWVEVEGAPGAAQLASLSAGVEININGKAHKTLPCQVRTIVPEHIADRNPPVNVSKHPVRSWLEIKLQEGKNRQVRRMAAKIGHPTLRLLRVAIEDLRLGDLQPAELTMISKNAIYRKLKID